MGGKNAKQSQKNGQPCLYCNPLELLNTLPFGGLPFGGLPFGGLPFGGLPFGGLPFGGLPFGGLPFGGLPFGGLGCGQGFPGLGLGSFGGLSPFGFGSFPDFLGCSPLGLPGAAPFAGFGCNNLAPLALPPPALPLAGCPPFRGIAPLAFPF